MGERKGAHSKIHWLTPFLTPFPFIKAVTEFIDPEFDQDIPNIRTNAKPLSAAEVDYQRMRYKLKHRQSGGRKTQRQRIEQALLPLLKPICFLKNRGPVRSSVVSEETRQRLRPQLQLSHDRLEKITGLDLGTLGYDVPGDSV